MKYFYSSFLITIIGFIIAYFLGGFSAIYIAFLLSILEISLSFDNAVVNAKTLQNMSFIWQKRFIVWGIPIAVFGMRFIFPLVIVAVASGLGVFETLKIAITNPAHYHEALEESKNEIYIFGGGFLLMVFNDFFFDKKREIYWLKILENNAVTNLLKKVPNMSVIIAIFVGLILIYEKPEYSDAYFSAILLHSLISGFDAAFDTNGIKNGLMGFLYLEILDASFSFDGVIGAFALSDNIFIIMIGLGIGAMFVRSITIFMVEKKTLENFLYLEHGAHYAILALAIIMFLKLYFEVSEIITGTIGFGFIFIAFICSIIKSKKII